MRCRPHRSLSSGSASLCSLCRRMLTAFFCAWQLTSLSQLPLGHFVAQMLQCCCRWRSSSALLSIDAAHIAKACALSRQSFTTRAGACTSDVNLSRSLRASGLRAQPALDESSQGRGSPGPPEGCLATQGVVASACGTHASFLARPRCIEIRMDSKLAARHRSGACSAPAAIAAVVPCRTRSFA